MSSITPMGDLRLGWGEGLLRDDRRDRQWFVDCAEGALLVVDGLDARVRAEPKGALG